MPAMIFLLGIETGVAIAPSVVHYSNGRPFLSGNSWKQGLFSVFKPHLPVVVPSPSD